MVDIFCFLLAKLQPFPRKKLGIPDLIIYMQQCIDLKDIALIVMAAFMATGIGMLIPRITRALTGSVLQSGSAADLIRLHPPILRKGLTKNLTILKR